MDDERPHYTRKAETKKAGLKRPTLKTNEMISGTVDQVTAGSHFYCSTALMLPCSVIFV
jgi:hypothetical protein